MQRKRLFGRATKLFGKAFLTLLLILIVVVAALHLPPVQDLISRKLSGYLSSKVEARIDIQKIRFSILGNLSVEGLVVEDRNKHTILTGRKIEVSSSILNLVQGDLIFDQVRLSGVKSTLKQSDKELNIQFIIDAFSSGEETSERPTPTTLQFHDILLEDILLEFFSDPNQMSATVKLGTLETSDLEFSTDPASIRINRVFLANSAVNSLSHSRNADSTIASQKVERQESGFDIGIMVEVDNIELKNNVVSFHKNTIVNPERFDPDHITLSDIQINIANLVVHPDTVIASLHSMSLQLPGFALDEGSGDLRLNQKQLEVSNFHFATGSSQLDANFSLPYSLESAEDSSLATFAIASFGRINPDDFVYFLSDSMMNLLSPLGPTDLDVEVNYAMAKGKIKNVYLKSAGSKVEAAGVINELADLPKLSWRDITINASIGSDLHKILAPFTQQVSIPDHLEIQVKSDGTLSRINTDVKVASTWGEAETRGSITPYDNYIDLDLNLTGRHLDIGKWLNLSWIGTIDLTTQVKGRAGGDQQLHVKAEIDNIVVQNHVIKEIRFDSQVREKNIDAIISVDDPNYTSQIDSKISFDQSVELNNHIRFHQVMLGNLLQKDSTLSVTGNTISKIILDKTSVKGYVTGDSIRLKNRFVDYSLDTLYLQTVISPDLSDIRYFTNNADAHLVSNFDMRELPDVIRTWTEEMFNSTEINSQSSGKRTAYARIDLKNAGILKLMGIEIDEFSPLRVTGEFDEEKRSTLVRATSGKFKAYGVALDTLVTDFNTIRDSINITLLVQNLLYDSIRLGNLTFDALTKGDTAQSNLLLSNDSVTLLGFRTRLFKMDSAMYVYPDALTAFGNEFTVDRNNPILLKEKKPVFNNFQISRGNTGIHLNGDLRSLSASVENVDLRQLNFFLMEDTTVVNKGRLSGKVSYSNDQPLEFDAAIDSLVLYNSNPLTVHATATRDSSRVPFQFLITDAVNTVDLKGQYFSATNEVDAAFVLDVVNPELFEFLVSDVIEDMKGAIKGKATIHGPLQRPAVEGSFRFRNTQVTTANPRLTFNIKDDSILLDNSSIRFDRFTLYDPQQHPLTVDGHITSQDYESFIYDLRIDSDEYTLVDNPDSTQRRIRGTLIVDSDIRLKGDGKDTNVEANVTVKDATRLSFVNDSDDIELLRSDGIVDFIDPTLLADSSLLNGSVNFYDSLIASLPEFNLSSKITVEENAVLGVIVDERSGDYIESSGAASLDFAYDRTGNLHLSGNYTITKGVYRLSFYDLVKKNFNLVPGSSINWGGSPKNGDLSIKAVNTVESNSIGLIGHEIGENEKSVYKRSLNYEVGINIDGPIEKPVITFSLDLPQSDKASYPVLANKLERLRQPEYESELNKQVFGLLVLGGFLPESSGSDINSGLIATTALSNSVNALLASQLNRFASQYVKGVDIDVGIQSYSDYSAPGGKTQTAMDFRVSKSVMDDRLSFEIGGDFDINQDQSGANTGNKNYRGDIAIIYDLTGNGDKQLKLFNNETYDIVYQEIRNTGISLIFIREFASKEQNTNEAE